MWKTTLKGRLERYLFESRWAVTGRYVHRLWRKVRRPEVGDLSYVSWAYWMIWKFNSKIELSRNSFYPLSLWYTAADQLVCWRSGCRSSGTRRNGVAGESANRRASACEVARRREKQRKSKLYKTKRIDRINYFLMITNTAFISSMQANHNGSAGRLGGSWPGRFSVNFPIYRCTHYSVCGFYLNFLSFRFALRRVFAVWFLEVCWLESRNFSNRFRWIFVFLKNWKWHRGFQAPLPNTHTQGSSPSSRTIFERERASTNFHLHTPAVLHVHTIMNSTYALFDWALIIDVNGLRTRPGSSENEAVDRTVGTID